MWTMLLLLWSVPLALGIFVLALLFFILGFFERLVLANFGAIWLVVVPPMTALGAMWALAYCLRSASRTGRISRRKAARADAIQSRIANLFTR